MTPQRSSDDQGVKLAVMFLRFGVAAEFLGHGIYAIQHKPSWLAFFVPFGIGPDAALICMTLVGSLDIALAGLLLLKPIRAAVLWMSIWGLWTALLRPISGLSILEFVERGAN